jgi:arylsulfatase A-like enzyme
MAQPPPQPSLLLRRQLLLLQLLLLLLLCAAPRPAAALSATPNVLFIAVDDLRPEHGVYGGAAVTPRVDAFAKTAMTFSRNYVQVGVCSPSRTSLLTGRYPDTTHITDLFHYFRTFGGPNATTLPETFRLAGHLTRGAGKIFHPGAASGAGLYKNCSGACGCGCGGYNDPPSWDGYQIPPSMARAPWNITDGQSWMALDEKSFPDSEHPDGQTAAFISAQLAAAGARPFFLAPGFLKPHLPFIFPKRFLDLYAGYDEVARDADPPANGPMARDSWTGWSEFRAYADIAALILADNLTEIIARPSNAMPRAKAVEVRRAYLAAVSYNDFVIGEVLDALTASGHDNDTTVVLWGDHVSVPENLHARTRARAHARAHTRTRARALARRRLQ